MIECSWSELKRVADSKSIPVQWVEVGDNYHIVLVDGPFSLYTLVAKDDGHEFVTGGYRTAGNRPVPNRATALPNPEDYRFRGNSTGWTMCTAGQTTNIEIIPSATEDRWVSGGILLTDDATRGDSVTFSVVHPIVGVVETYVPSWSVLPGTTQQRIEVYPARIPAGLRLRVSYTSTGSTNAYCAVNYYLHRRGAGA